VLLVLAAVAGVGLPIYRVSSQGSIAAPEAQAQTDMELGDQGGGVVGIQTNTVRIPTRLLYHTNGTASVWFQAQSNGLYRIDYADTKASTLSNMDWSVAVDRLTAVTNSWTEWVDAGATNRPPPGEVKQRYYRVVLEAASGNSTSSASGETIQQSSPLWGTGVSTNTDTNTVEGTRGGDAESTASLPSEILQLLQNQASLTQLTQSGSARNLAALQESETLGELVAGGQASEGALSNALAASKLRISMLMTFGQSLFLSGDRHHAEMFFGSVVQNHANHATAKQLARSYLWLGKLYQDDGLGFKYQQGQTDQASVAFQTAAVNFLTAKDDSQDWVRGNGWLGAAACYRELADPEKQRECLRSLLAEPIPMPSGAADQSSTGSQHPDNNLGLINRDMATYEIANSYYQQNLYAAAAQIYQQLHDSINGRPEAYPGQTKYLELATTGLNWSSAAQAKQAANNPAKGQAAQ